MLGKFINFLLHRYISASYIVRNKARVILYLILTMLIINPVLMVYHSLVSMHDPAYHYSIQMEVIVPEAIAFILFFIMLVTLIMGYLSLAGNLLLVICQMTIWIIIFLSKTDLVTRIDTVVLIAATLSTMPIIIVNRKKLFIAYTLANIVILFIFMILYKNTLNLSDTAFTDYLSDNTLAFIFTGIVSYTIFSINSGALKKAENEIAERKKSEEQRNRLQMQLLQSQKLESVGLLAGGVAHDFNNILAAVQGFAELAAENVDNGSRAKIEIDQIILASKKARDLTHQLLAFARIQPLDMKEIEINEIIREFTGMLSRTLRGNITIKSNLCENPGSIEGDPVQIEQVILNLILNSQDAMPGGGTIIIETSRVNVEDDFVKRFEHIKPGPYMLLSISDIGSGIGDDIIDNIFDPFFTTKDSGKGTGLGLSTVYGIVKQHKGMIHVYSEKEEGTIFRIYLPVINNNAGEKIPPVMNTDHLKGSETILAVEDNPEVRNLLEAVLKKNGYTPFIAENAETALAVSSAYNGTIDLLITDVIIPDMNGMELHNKISEMRPGIKVIYISGYTSNVIAHNGKVDDGINFIQKPFSIADFTKKVRDVLDSKL